MNVTLTQAQIRELADSIVDGLMKEQRKQTLTTAEAAARLGIKPDTLRRKVRKGDVNCHKVGQRLMFYYDDIEGLI